MSTRFYTCQCVNVPSYVFEETLETLKQDVHQLIG